MIQLRSLLYFFGLIVTVIVFALPMFTIGLLLPQKTAGKIACAWGRSNLWLLKYICRLDYEVHGWEENFPQHNAIIMAKHQSSWETIALRGILPPQQAWILKRELMWIPLFGWALAASGAIAIDRSAGRKAILQIVAQGVQRLRDGAWVVIFPEGTRTAPGERRKYGVGGALLAEKSGYPVIPIAHNAGVFWRRRSLTKLPGTIQVVIGPPIQSEGRSAAEINREVEEWIENTVASLPQSAEEF
jgi:1-acyl-sn-glycerol-3-phosphate acyltransferase